jgi:hypothetical protein
MTMLNARDDAFVKGALNEELRAPILKNLEYFRMSLIFLTAAQSGLFLWGGERITGLLVMGHAILLMHSHHTIIALKLLRSLNLSTGPLSHEDKLAMERRAVRTWKISVGVVLIALFAVLVGVSIHQSMK